MSAGVKHGQYVYVPHEESKPYFDMAHEWVSPTECFSRRSTRVSSAHQYIIAAQAHVASMFPWSWGCEGGRAIGRHDPKERHPARTAAACFDYKTLGDELDKAGLSWRFYSSQYGYPFSGFGAEWSAYQAVKHIFYGPDWKKDVISPNWKFITDVRAGKLADFTWITPVCGIPIT